MPWSTKAYMEFFVQFQASVEGQRMVRAIAGRRGVASLSDDLAQCWYLSIRSTLDRLDARGASLPEWVDDEPAAIRYAMRALDNDATDIFRVEHRHEARRDDFDDGRAVSIDLPDRGPGTEQAAIVAVALDDMRREVSRRFRQGLLGSAQCLNGRVASIVLAVIESLDGNGPRQAKIRGGGIDEWDELVYDVLQRMEPAKFSSPHGRMNAAARQMKTRCGRRAREVLMELFGRRSGDEEVAWPG